MRLVIAGGGTGGHVYPGLAVAAEMQLEDLEAEILFIGTERGLEAALVPKAKFNFCPIHARGIQRRLSWRILPVLFENLQGFFEARRILKEFEPDVVLGVGGYASAAGVFAAWTMGIPTVIHEQNVFPGITNRLLARLAGRVLVSNPDCLPHFPKRPDAEVVGNPIRHSILRVGKELAVRKLELSPQKITILVFGGSQGAASINRAMVDAIRRLRIMNARFQVIFVTGPAHYEETAKALRGSLVDVRVMPYLDEMPMALGAADLVVCRAGATTVAEITAKGIPAVLIPFPFATGNHQEYNARSLVEAGGSWMIRDSELTGGGLAEIIKEVLQDPTRLEAMSEAMRKLGVPNAAELIVGVLRESAGRRKAEKEEAVSSYLNGE